MFQACILLLCCDGCFKLVLYYCVVMGVLSLYFIIVLRWMFQACILLLCCDGCFKLVFYYCVVMGVSSLYFIIVL